MFNNRIKLCALFELKVVILSSEIQQCSTLLELNVFISEIEHLVLATKAEGIIASGKMHMVVFPTEVPSYDLLLSTG